MSISKRTRCSRITGSGSPMGRSHRNAAIWLPEPSPGVRTLTGTIARIELLVVTGSPRVSIQARRAPARIVSTMSLIVPPWARLIRLSFSRSVSVVA